MADWNDKLFDRLKKLGDVIDSKNEQGLEFAGVRKAPPSDDITTEQRSLEEAMKNLADTGNVVYLPPGNHTAAGINQMMSQHQTWMQRMNQVQQQVYASPPQPEPALPRSFMDAMTDYAKKRQLPDDRVACMILKNDLRGVVREIDGNALAMLPDVFKFLETLPRECYGSPQKVEAWVTPPKPKAPPGPPVETSTMDELQKSLGK